MPWTGRHWRRLDRAGERYARDMRALRDRVTPESQEFAVRRREIEQRYAADRAAIRRDVEQRPAGSGVGCVVAVLAVVAVYARGRGLL